MRLSTMRNETITAFQKVFKMLFTYITHVQQSLMLCPKFLSEKIHRITSIMSINYMTPRQPYKMNKVRKNIPLLRYDIVFSKIYVVIPYKNIFNRYASYICSYYEYY